MRVLLSVVVSALVLALGTAASLVQCRNHARAARLDDLHRKLELTRMFSLDAEAEILASETRMREDMLRREPALEVAR